MSEFPNPPGFPVVDIDDNNNNIDTTLSFSPSPARSHSPHPRVLPQAVPSSVFAATPVIGMVAEANSIEMESNDVDDFAKNKFFYNLKWKGDVEAFVGSLETAAYIVEVPPRLLKGMVASALQDTPYATWMRAFLRERAGRDFDAAEFGAHLRALSGTLPDADKAAEELASIQQGKSETVEAYNARFSTVVLRTGLPYPDKALRIAYRKGLKDRRLVEASLRENFGSYHELMAFVARAAGHNVLIGGGAELMEIGAAPSFQLPRRAENKKNVKCFRCQKLGHIAAHCLAPAPVTASVEHH